MDQLIANLKRLGALDHRIDEQSVFDKDPKMMTFQIQDNNMQFELQFDEVTVRFPLQWRGHPQLLLAEYLGVYSFLTANLRVEGKVF